MYFLKLLLEDLKLRCHLFCLALQRDLLSLEYEFLWNAKACQYLSSERKNLLPCPWLLVKNRRSTFRYVWCYTPWKAQGRNVAYTQTVRDRIWCSGLSLPGLFCCPAPFCCPEITAYARALHMCWREFFGSKWIKESILPHQGPFIPKQ